MRTKALISFNYTLFVLGELREKGWVNKYDVRLKLYQATPPEKYARHKKRQRYTSREYYFNYGFSRLIWTMERTGLLIRRWQMSKSPHGGRMHRAQQNYDMKITRKGVQRLNS